MNTLFARKAISLVLVLLCYNARGINGASWLDKAVVTVNGSPITEQEIQEEISLIKKYTKASTAPKAIALKNLIMEELVVQTAERSGINMASPEINEIINRYLASNQVQKELAKNTGKLKRKIFAELMQQDMVMSAAGTVSSEDVEKQMKDLPAETERDLQVQFDLETLIIPQHTDSVAKKATWQRLLSCFRKSSNMNNLDEPNVLALETAKKVLVQAQEGASFKAIATAQKRKPAWKIKNISSTADKLPVAYSAALAALNPNDVAGPFEFHDGLHLIRLKKASGKRILRARHILLRASSDEDSEKAKQTLERIQKNCLSNEKIFAEQAEKYSEDINTVFKGGDLGWILPDALEKPFDEVLKTLKLKEVSAPFKTNDGWHIVQLTQKEFLTPAHPEWKKSLATHLVREKKVLNEMETLYKRLYRSAHIEILDPTLKPIVFE